MSLRASRKRSHTDVSAASSDGDGPDRIMKDIDLGEIIVRSVTDGNEEADFIDLADL